MQRISLSEARERLHFFFLIKSSGGKKNQGLEAAWLNNCGLKW
jgi:hypothetical protein